MSSLLLEPLKYYEQEGREKQKQNVESFLCELKERSGVDVEQNKRTVASYRQKEKEIGKLQKKLSRKKLLRVFLFILCGVGIFMTIGGISSPDVLLILFGVLAIAAPIVFIFSKLNKGIKNFSCLIDSEKKRANELLAKAWEEMVPLNSLFTDKDTIDIIEKTLPELNFDDHFSAEREREIRELCGYSAEYDENRSVIDALSGKYKGNPFIFERHLIHRLGEETYYGSLTITWTERYRDSKGNTRTRVRTQTLRASVVKPKPFYHQDTVLKYFPQGAPSLSFTREGLYHDDKSDKQIERIVKKGEKKLKKKTQDSISHGGSFTEMANTEFDVLFDALNRDNEVEFRMMFTPLAQNNMVDLMRSEVGYGDDFDFYKQKRTNIIHSDHAQVWRMDSSAKNYHSFDFEEIKEKFKTINEEYFKSVFFDFAPLLAIPMYQEKPVKSLEPPKEYNVNYTVHEYETLANRMEQGLFVAPRSATKAILKAQGVKRTGETDTVEMTGYAYETLPRTDFVPVYGGDGKVHMVPVHWTEYIPNSHTSYIEVGKDDKTRKTEEKGDRAVYHGLVANYFGNQK